MLKLASRSGSEGELMILHVLVSPRPFLSHSLVVDACAMIFPPMGLMLGPANTLAPSRLAATTCPHQGYVNQWRHRQLAWDSVHSASAFAKAGRTWFVTTTAQPNSSASLCKLRKKRPRWIWRADSSPRPLNSVLYSAVTLSTMMSANLESDIMDAACSRSWAW